MFVFFLYGSIIVGILSLPLGYFLKLVHKNNVLAAKFMFFGGLLSFGLFGVALYIDNSTPLPLFYFKVGAGPALLSIILGARLDYISKKESNIPNKIHSLGRFLLILILMIAVLFIVLYCKENLTR